MVLYQKVAFRNHENALEKITESTGKPCFLLFVHFYLQYSRFCAHLGAVSTEIHQNGEHRLHRPGNHPGQVHPLHPPNHRKRDGSPTPDGGADGGGCQQPHPRPHPPEEGMEQIVQKILPKIYGDRKQIGELLDTLEEKCKNGIGDSSEEMTLSLKKIEQMKKRLDKYQYASFM